MADLTTRLFSTRSRQAPAAGSGLQQKIVAEQVNALMNAAVAVSVTAVVNAIIVCAVLQGAVPAAHLLGWLGLVLGFGAIRLWLLIRWRRGGRDTVAAETWLRWITVLAVFSGLVWGASALLLFVPGSMAHQAFIAIVVAGMAAGGLVSLSVHVPAYVGYAVPSVLPVAAAFLVQGEKMPVAIGVMALIFLVATLLIVRGTHRNYRESLILRFQNETLLEDLKAALHKAEAANQAKSEFLASISHELKTPLSSVIGYADVVALRLREVIAAQARDDKAAGRADDRSKIPPEIADHVNAIRLGGQHLLGMINDILDFRRMESGTLALHEEAVHLEDLIQNSLSLAGERLAAAQLTIAVDCPAELSLLRADRRRTLQMLINLISNAIKFTPAGGHIDIRAGQTDDDRTFITIADTGIGMSEAELELAMQPFGQVNSKLNRAADGTGLGLPLVQAMIREHGGVLQIESTPNVGTAATLWFPAGRTMTAEAR